ncbi:MAG: DNA cytosine methyltransferase [Chloracidobacterium sp.]|nr:DNA cytosine methyltransferase [Chloracidobacterium sp.]MDW8217600.1 DNA cytosine methyltransferase [Acidobacteriota bacterium]
MVQRRQPPPTAVEYFAGIGLVGMALRRSGWRILFANDVSPKKAAFYRVFFPHETDVYRVGDVFDLRPEDVPPATLAACSFPCIDVSLAGKMAGIKDRKTNWRDEGWGMRDDEKCAKERPSETGSSAFWGFARLLEQQGDRRPPLLLLENVPGWLYANDGRDFRVTVGALADLGYACDVLTLDARRFTPQSRPRVFLIGVTPRWKAFFAAPEVGNRNRLLARPAGLLSPRLREAVHRNADLPWFALSLPLPPPLRAGGLNDILEPLAEHDPRWWTLAETERHLAMMSAAHRVYVEKLAAAPVETCRTFYRRRRADGQRAEVRTDDIAGCLRTAAGGNGRQFLVRAGCGRLRMRALTAREYVRLQGVPDDIPLDGTGLSETQAVTAFGDAVCVPAVAWVADHHLGKALQLQAAGGRSHVAPAAYSTAAYQPRLLPDG